MASVARVCFIILYGSELDPEFDGVFLEESAADDYCEQMEALNSIRYWACIQPLKDRNIWPHSLSQPDQCFKIEPT